jgi:hypothetical protein
MCANPFGIGETLTILVNLPFIEILQNISPL